MATVSPPPSSAPWSLPTPDPTTEDDRTTTSPPSSDEPEHEPPSQSDSPPVNPTTTTTEESNPSAPSSPPPTILYVCFNQDKGCFAAATSSGFRIFNCDPFREIFRRTFDAGGIGSVEMLFRCNILALVGGGPQPQYPPSKVMIWDDHQCRCIGELSFRSEVRGVRLKRDRIVVVLEHKVFVYNFADLKLVQQIETVPNPRGLCVLSQLPGPLVLVCPGAQKGQVRVEHYATRKTKFIMAHDSRIVALELSQDGKFIATASSKGTLVRVFGTNDGTLLQEVRRGADRADIYSLAFSENMKWLGVSSDKGTVHVFNLKVNTGSTADKPCPTTDSGPTSPPAGSSLSFIKGVLPKYFHSEWSLAQFRLHEGCQYVVAFGHQKNTVVILGMDGSFYRCEFDPVAGGEMKQLECHYFLKAGESL